ncbi:hypothetical protein HPB50_018279 [Hyalomma asiaticum]|uniref:Uncharacterized protein n=1 Tax=Hyalomma asiaticum TaxID=266040 RepID=A0ACB7SGW1_HYAAI|nr:hypothetical protein HPB50_018279 [Hyalomma asiaticum]
MALDWLTQYLTLENVCLGVNLVTLSVIYKAYRSKVTNFEAVQTARQLDIDSNLASKLREEYPNATAVHALLRGQVKAIGEKIKSRHMRGAKAVIQECCLTEHKIQWSPVSRFWSQTQREIHRIINYVPFALASKHSNVMVEVLDPQECESIPVNCVYENFIPNRDGLSGVFFGWLRGEQTKGIEEQEFLLEEGTTLTAFGTLTVMEDGSVKLMPPTDVVPPLKTEETKPGAQDASKPSKDQTANAPHGTEAKGTEEAAKTTQPSAAMNSEQQRPKGPEVHEISLEDIDPESTDVDFTHCRIGKLSNLEGLRRVEVLIFRNNLLKKIENVHMLVTLKEIEFYDNQITKIENLECLVNLETLDISFNRLTHIENLDSLVKLKKLFLVNNRITKIENLDKLVNLELLELGSNRIKAGCIQFCLILAPAIENLDQLVNIKNLFLGKNRISKLQNLEPLKKLELLSIQVKLETLDLAANKIKHLTNIKHLINIEEFWFNDNEIESFEELEVLRNFPKLATVYLHSNPIEKDPMYRRKIMMISPTVKQIDATMCRK